VSALRAHRPANRAADTRGPLAVALLHGNRKKRALSGVPPAVRR